MSETTTSCLRRQARAPVLPGEAHRDALESELAARFGTVGKGNVVVSMIFRSAVAAGLLAAVGAGASQLPASYQAEVGKRVDIRVPGTPPPGAVQAAVRSIEGGAQEGKRTIQVRVRVTREPEKGALVRIDATGDTIGMEGIPDAIRASSPFFASAEISVQAIQAQVDGDVAGLVASKVLGERLSAAQIIEEAVRSQLAAEGVDAKVKVDLKTDASDGKVRHEVKVIVEKNVETGTR
jgi:hypothetical protein